MSTVTFNRNGAIKTVPKGYSFTTLLFGFIPSMLRGHWPFFWKMLIADIGSLLISAALFKGQDAFGILIAVRLGAGYFRNAELHRYLREDGWFAPSISASEPDVTINVNQPAANDLVDKK